MVLGIISLVDHEDALEPARGWLDTERAFKHPLSDVMEQASVLIPLGKVMIYGVIQCQCKIIPLVYPIKLFCNLPRFGYF